jgi:chromosome segregation ATPase
VTSSFGLVIESMVSMLLLLTIGYCFVLNSKLRRLKADEQALKATIAELITATEIAERAIAGLKVTVRECDQTIGERLRTAERFSADIAHQIEAGTEIVDRLARIVSAGRPEQTPAPAPAPIETQPRRLAATDSRAMLAAARAFAERSRARANGVAA